MRLCGAGPGCADSPAEQRAAQVDDGFRRSRAMSDNGIYLPVDHCNMSALTDPLNSQPTFTRDAPGVAKAKGRSVAA